MQVCLSLSKFGILMLKRRTLLPSLICLFKLNCYLLHSVVLQLKQTLLRCMMKCPYLKQTNGGLISTQGVAICNDFIHRYSDYDSAQKWLQNMPQHATNSSHCWHATMLLHQLGIIQISKY